MRTHEAFPEPAVVGNLEVEQFVDDYVEDNQITRLPAMKLLEMKRFCGGIMQRNKRGPK
jgi:hypothetical protein